MKIALFGATGGTGRRFVEQARARGHDVRALVRPTATDPPAGIDRVVGDATDPDAVAATLSGTDAAVVVLGLPKGEGTTVSEATGAIVAAMGAQGPSRLVVVTVQGLNDSRDRAGFFGKVVVNRLARKRFEDRARQEDVVTASALDWTIVRPSRLTDDGPTGPTVDPATRTGMSAKTSRADLAAALVALVETGDHGRQAVTVTS